MNKLNKIMKKFINFLIPKEDDSHEFKPILAEIEDKPMNPIGPTVFWLVISFMVISVLWLYFGKVDVVVTARGIVIPAGEEKLVQSLDKGVVSELLAKEGDYVKKGQLLAVVSPAEHEPALDLNNLAEEEKSLIEQIGADKDRLRIAQANRQRLSEVIDIIPQSKYDEVVVEITTLTHEINSLSASLSEVRNKRQQIEKLRQELKSPIDGYVGQIFVHTVGGVVTPAEKIMSVVPDKANLQIKATVLNQDIGFVETDMPVSIKLDTYNFQKYGLLSGIVTVVSPNSIEDERLGQVYEVYIKPTTTKLMVEGKEQSMKIGMSTTNEIKIGKRRIIEFFIYPLIKYLDESIKVQ